MWESNCFDLMLAKPFAQMEASAYVGEDNRKFVRQVAVRVNDRVLDCASISLNWRSHVIKK